MHNDERDVLHHITKAEHETRTPDMWLAFHIGTAIALAILEVARAIREGYRRV